MKFEVNKMYRHLYQDLKMAFIVDEVLGQGANGSDLIVTWYQQTDNGRYISIGVDGEFHIPKDNVMYYMEI